MANQHIAWAMTTLFIVAPPAVADSSNSEFLQWTTRLNLTNKYHDNILLEDSGATSSVISTLNPQLFLGTDNGINRSSLAYSGESGTYHSSSADSYIDHRIDAKVHHAFLRHFTADLNAGYYLSHENRGTGFSRGGADLLDRPDRYNVLDINTVIILGTRESIGRVGINGGQRKLSYDTRKDVTEVRNYSKTSGGLTYFHNISPRTSLLFEVIYHQIAYTSGLADRDGSEWRFLAGTSWELSRLTKGEIKIGQNVKQFKDGNRSTARGFGWEIGLDWSPSRLADFKLVSSGRTEEAIGFGDYLDSRSLSIGGQYDLTKQLAISASLSAKINRYPPTTAKDTLLLARFIFDYKVVNWLAIGLGTENSQHISNQPGLDFATNIYISTISLTY